MFPPRLIALAFALLGACPTHAGAVEFLTDYVLNPNAPLATSDTAWTSESFDSTQTLFVWGIAGDPSNSVRTLTYTGTQRYKLTGISQSSTIQNTWGASGNNATYIDSSDLLTNDLLYQLTVNGDGLDVALDTGAVGFIDTPTTISGSATIAEGSLSNRLIQNGTILTFEFFNNGAFGQVPDLPDAMFTQPLLISLQGDAVNATISVLPSQNAFGNRRTGTGPFDSPITISNTGEVGSLLTGSAAAAVNTTSPPVGAGFASSLTPFSLDKTSSTNPSVQVPVSFTPRISIGHTDTSGIADAGTVAITSDAATNPSVSQVLSGTTVSPIFAYKYNGSEVIGGTLDLNATALTPTGIIELALANLFGTDFGSLTDLTLISIALDPIGSPLFSLITPPSAGTIVHSLNDAQLQLLFSGTAPGTYSTILSVWGDDNQVLCTNLATCARTQHLLAVNVTVSGVPAPTTIVLLMSGIAGLALGRRR